MEDSIKNNKNILDNNDVEQATLLTQHCRVSKIFS